MTSSKHRRSNYWIKKSFQSRFSLRFAVLILVEAALISVLFFFISRGTLTTGYHGSEVRVENTAYFFMTAFLMISAIAAVAMALVAMLVFIFFSHRIAGPVYHIQKSLGKIMEGNLTYRVRLRRKDELTDLAEDVNKTAQFLEKKISQMKREISSRKPDGETLKNLKEIVDSFKTS